MNLIEIYRLYKEDNHPVMQRLIGACIINKIPTNDIPNICKLVLESILNSDILRNKSEILENTISDELILSTMQEVMQKTTTV